MRRHILRCLPFTLRSDTVYEVSASGIVHRPFKMQVRVWHAGTGVASASRISPWQPLAACRCGCRLLTLLVAVHMFCALLPRNPGPLFLAGDPTRMASSARARVLSTARLRLSWLAS
jgi:hypothetical protein